MAEEEDKIRKIVRETIIIIIKGVISKCEVKMFWHSQYQNSKAKPRRWRKE